MFSPPYRIFFDTSVYIAGLLSNKGAAKELLSLAETNIVCMVISEDVIKEIDAVVERKFPGLVQDSRALIKDLNPELSPSPNSSQIKAFQQVLPAADAAILCSANLAAVSMFVTWNTRDFMKKQISDLVDFPIVVPAEALEIFRKWINPYFE